MTPLERIYPAPREIRLLDGGPGRLPDAADAPINTLREGRPGAYRIAFDGSALAASAVDADGIASARSVLRTLGRHAGEPSPRFEIRDHPRYAVRGLMLDVSRDRVPTMDHLRELARTMSLLRLNHLQLYVEHTFAYAGHEAIWAGTGALTPDEIRTLDRWCADLGIELAANQNTFGHLSAWLRHPAYADLAETHGAYDFYGITRGGPFSLCPIDPRSVELVRDWLRQLRPCFTSARLNIGCDETADVGAGRSAEAVRGRGKAAVYAEYVSSVANAAASLGFAPMFWADIALASPEILDDLPGDLMPLAWGYEPDSPFDRWAQTLRTAGRRGWVCPGTSCWRSFTGRTAERRGNLAAATAATEPFDGMLITAWGDVGHRQRWPVTLHALADAAHAAWHGEAPTESGAASAAVFGDRRLGPWLDALGDADRPIRTIDGDASDAAEPRPLRNATALFNELYPADPAAPPRGSLDQWRATLDRLRSLQASMPSADPLVDAELGWTLDVSEFAARLAIARRRGDRDDRLGRLLEHVIDEHQRLWALRARPENLDSSTQHFDRLRAELQGAGS